MLRGECMACLPPRCPTPVHLCRPCAGLNSEQLALLDFLILARSHKFVGFGPSTFSTYLKEHRILHGRPPSLRWEEAKRGKETGGTQPEERRVGGLQSGGTGCLLPSAPPCLTSLRPTSPAAFS